MGKTKSLPVFSSQTFFLEKGHGERNSKTSLRLLPSVPSVYMPCPVGTYETWEKGNERKETTQEAFDDTRWRDK